MPGIITEIDMTQGHCWPSTSIDLTTIKNKTVFINGKKIIGFGDKYLEAPHTGCTVPPTTHPVIASIVASPTVFINNIPVLRDGDPLSCGDVANSQGASVFADGGGFGPVTTLPNFGPSATTGYSVGNMLLEYPTSSIRVHGKFLRRNVGTIRDPEYTYDFIEWCGPLYIEPTWRIEVVEEGTGRIYYNTKDGIPDLPQLQPGIDELLRNPMPVKFKVTGGNLPSWASFDENTGIIQGTPDGLFDLVTFKVSGYISSISSSNLRTRRPVDLSLWYSRVIRNRGLNGLPLEECPNRTY